MRPRTTKPPEPLDADPRARAIAYRHATHARVCDRIEPWAHGTAVSSSRLPGYWDYNVVRVEDDVEMAADEVVRVGEQLLGRERAVRRPQREVDERPADVERDARARVLAFAHTFTAYRPRNVFDRYRITRSNRKPRMPSATMPTNTHSVRP